MFDIYYQQTFDERYETDMNARVRDVLEGANIDIVEEYGGTAFDVSPDELPSEAGFVVDASMVALNAVSGRINAIVGRNVKVTEVND